MSNLASALGPHPPALRASIPGSSASPLSDEDRFDSITSCLGCTVFLLIILTSLSIPSILVLASWHDDPEGTCFGGCGSYMRLESNCSELTLKDLCEETFFKTPQENKGQKRGSGSSRVPDCTERIRAESGEYQLGNITVDLLLDCLEPTQDSNLIIALAVIPILGFMPMIFTCLIGTLGTRLMSTSLVFMIQAGIADLLFGLNETPAEVPCDVMTILRLSYAFYLIMFMAGFTLRRNPVKERSLWDEGWNKWISGVESLHGTACHIIGLLRLSEAPGLRSMDTVNTSGRSESPSGLQLTHPSDLRNYGDGGGPTLNDGELSVRSDHTKWVNPEMCYRALMSGTAPKWLSFRHAYHTCKCTQRKRDQLFLTEMGGLASLGWSCSETVVHYIQGFRTKFNSITNRANRNCTGMGANTRLETVSIGKGLYIAHSGERSDPAHFYYFLGVKRPDNRYHVTHILRCDTFVPLIPEITHGVWDGLEIEVVPSYLRVLMTTKSISSKGRKFMTLASDGIAIRSHGIIYPGLLEIVKVDHMYVASWLIRDDG